VTAPQMKPLKAIGQIAAVTVAIFIKVFPLSGILFGLLVIFFLASLGDFNDFRTWFQGPKSWWNCVAMALLASLASMFISYCLLRLFRASPFGGPDYSRFSVVHGNGKLLLIWLLLIWTIVALGEEIIGRGFIINRLLVVFERTFNPSFLAIAVSAMIFGSVHFYQGIAGVVDNTCTGIIFGTLYLNQGRNLWSNFLSHGFIDSIVVLIFYFGAGI
jgi:membrane protease YdiL (CAAX protease family)